jgi:hypothetical protein
MFPVRTALSQDMGSSRASGRSGNECSVLGYFARNIVCLLVTKALDGAASAASHLQRSGGRNDELPGKR